MSINKNAYEIRADILNQAQGLVMTRYDKDFQVWESSVLRHPDSGNIISTKDVPAFPTTDEILKTANELYSFVDTK
jgi:hypothetical protein|tara:strand:- start:275 stop:502 length:228 start_codon:yes stop_codon:yes gene_type:complete